MKKGDNFVYFIGMNTKFSHLIKFIITGYRLNPLIFYVEWNIKTKLPVLNFSNTL